MGIIGYTRAFLGYIYEDKLGLVAFITLLSLIAFSLVGPIVYPVDPHTVHRTYGVKIDLVNLENFTIVGSIKLEMEKLRVALAHDGNLILLDDNGVLRLSPLAEVLTTKSPIAYNVLNIDVHNGVVYIAMKSEDSLITVGRLKGVEVEGIHSIRLTEGMGSLKSIASHGDALVLVFDRSVLLVDKSSGLTSRYDVDFTLNDVTTCWGKIVIGGVKGRVLIIDPGGITTLRVFVDDVISVNCINDVVYVLGAMGSMALIERDSSYKPVMTGVVEDLIGLVPLGDGVLVIGSMGSILFISGDHVTLKASLGGLRGVRFASIDSNRLILTSFGEFVKDLEPPSLSHPLGTDYYGRDVLAQVMVGIRMSLLIAFIAATLVTFIGSTLGIIAGYFRGRVDSTINSLVNFMYSIPLEPFAILLAIVLKPGMLTVILAISLLIWRTTARIVRSQTLSVASTPMVEAARALGAPHSRIIVYYIVPAILPIILVDFASTMVYAILAEATLSFIGVGPQETFTLGTILNHARITGAWREGWWLLTPGIFIGIITISMYIIVRTFEPIANPKLRRT